MTISKMTEFFKIGKYFEIHIYLVQDHASRNFYKKKKNRPGFPGGAVVKNPPANVGDMGSSRGLGRSHMPRSN